MNREQFIHSLRQGLSGLSQEDIEAQVSFYNEMIDDRMEEGLTEEQAIDQIGPVTQIIGQARLDVPQKKAKRKLSALEIVLLVLGSPIWISLLAAAFSVVLAFYIVLWSVVISLWAVEVSLGACFFASIVVLPIFILKDYPLSGLAYLAFGLVCAGLSIFGFYGLKYLSKGCAILSKKTFLAIRSIFVRKENA